MLGGVLSACPLKRAQESSVFIHCSFLMFACKEIHPRGQSCLFWGRMTHSCSPALFASYLKTFLAPSTPRPHPSTLPRIFLFIFSLPFPLLLSNCTNQTPTFLELLAVWLCQVCHHLRTLTLSLLRVVNVIFPLQPHQKYYIKHYKELSF